MEYISIIDIIELTVEVSIDNLKRFVCLYVCSKKEREINKFSMLKVTNILPCHKAHEILNEYYNKPQVLRKLLKSLYLIVLK